MRLAITGAAGFVGRAVTNCLLEQGFDGEVRLFDRSFDGPQPFAAIEADLCDPGTLSNLVEWADCIIHLAALPGGAAQSDPRNSRRINLDVPLDLIELLEGKRLIYASSIAVLGSDFSGPVDDATPARPDSVYGTHKRMVELAFGDAVRRRVLSGLAIRLPGVVARPPESLAGFGSAFLSEVFHAARSGTRYTLPVSSDAASWLVSADICAANLVYAAMSTHCEAEAVTMPALYVQMADLLSELAQVYDISGIDHAEQPGIRRAFGSYPDLATERGMQIGMTPDAGIAALISTVLANG